MFTALFGKLSFLKLSRDVRQINKNFKLIFLSIFLLHHTGDVNRIHILFEF